MTIGTKSTIVLADDHLGILKKVSEIIGDNFLVVGKANDGLSSVRVAMELVPDVLILDIAMPNLDGIQVAHEVRRRGLKSKIIFLTVQGEDGYLETARTLGASFVLKSKMHQDLLIAIRETLSGHRFVSTPNHSHSHL
jgi:DNA-binding NarL/FixJ family response regulator